MIQESPMLESNDTTDIYETLSQLREHAEQLPPGVCPCCGTSGLPVEEIVPGERAFVLCAKCEQEVLGPPCKRCGVQGCVCP